MKLIQTILTISLLIVNVINASGAQAQCTAYETFCCEPATPGVSSYTIAEVKGCGVWTSDTCAGDQVTIWSNLTGYDYSCMCGDSVVNATADIPNPGGWGFHCSSLTCMKGVLPETDDGLSSNLGQEYELYSSFCDLSDIIDAVNRSVIALVGGVIAIIVFVVVSIAALIIGCALCCHRRRHVIRVDVGPSPASEGKTSAAIAPV